MLLRFSSRSGICIILIELSPHILFYIPRLIPLSSRLFPSRKHSLGSDRSWLDCIERKPGYLTFLTFFFVFWIWTLPFFALLKILLLRNPSSLSFSSFYLIRRRLYLLFFLHIIYQFGTLFIISRKISYPTCWLRPLFRRLSTLLSGDLYIGLLLDITLFSKIFKVIRIGHI